MKKILIFSFIICSLFLFWSCGSDDNPVNQTGRNFDPFALWDTAGTIGSSVQCLAAKDTFLYAGTSDSGVFVSTNNGISWALSSTGLTGSGLNVRSFLIKDTVIIAATANRLYRSTNNGASWAAFGTGITPASTLTIVPKDTNLFVGTSNGVYRSTDGGLTWNSSGLGSYIIRTFGLKKNVFFAGTTNGVYKSTDNGANWQQIIDGLVGAQVYALAAKDSFLIAATSVDVFRTSNDSSWTLVGEGLPSGTTASAFFVTGSSLLIGFYGYEGIYLSINNGVSWVSCNAGIPVPFSTNAFLYNGAYLFIGGINQGAGGGVWRHAL